jgi:hypothetical protein
MENWKVYMHKSPSGKVYIGITKRDLEIRWANGEGYKTCPIFYNAIKKYGWENIEHRLLFENLNDISAKLIEIDLIYYYKSIDMSYNLTDGGQGQLGIHRYGEENPFCGHTQSEEAKRKISDAQIGVKNNMYGTHAPLAIQIDGKYLTDYAKELNVPYARFYLYFVRHNKNLQETINFYKNKV